MSYPSKSKHWLPDEVDALNYLLTHQAEFNAAITHGSRINVNPFECPAPYDLEDIMVTPLWITYFGDQYLIACCVYNVDQIGYWIAQRGPQLRFLINVQEWKGYSL